MAIESIVKSLGSGSGIDVGALVTSLVEAQFSLKTKQLDDRAEKLEARISGVSTLKGMLTSFESALKSLVTGGTLQSRLTSSNEAVVKVSPAGESAGAPDISARLEVSSLASAQVSTTNTAYAAGTQFGTGTLTLRLGADVVDAAGAVTGFTAGGSAIDIAIDGADRTLAGIAAKINAANAGVTARIVADGTGERLSIAGANGAAKAFEIRAVDAGDGTGTSLTSFTVDRTATQTASPTRARDAAVVMDGVRYTRSSNTITDLIPGAKLELTGVSATPVTLSATRQTGALTGALNDFVAAYNETLAVVKAANDPKTGALRADSAVESTTRALQRMTTQTLITDGATGGPRTLADLGVATARDGTLSVNAARLAKAVAGFPADVERIFTAGAGGTGLSGALSSLVLRATSTISGLGASATTYGKQKQGLADDRLKATAQSDALKARLTKQFSGMDARVSAYKSTQSFLDNQIKAWNRSDA